MTTVLLALILSIQDSKSPADKPAVPVEASKTVEQAPPEKGDAPAGKVIDFDSDEPVRPAADRKPITAPNLGWTVFWTLFVLTALIGALFLLRKFLRNSKYVMGGGAIDIVARKMLEENARLYLVEVGRTMFLIGQTKETLATLGTMRDPEEVAAIRGTVQGKKPRKFERSLEQEIRDGEKDDAMTDVLSQIKDMRGHLRDLKDPK